jgi:hypothetical protein
MARPCESIREEKKTPKHLLSIRRAFIGGEAHIFSIDQSLTENLRIDLEAHHKQRWVFTEEMESKCVPKPPSDHDAHVLDSDG